MKVILTIFQAKDEAMEVSDFRYGMVFQLEDKRKKAVATSSLYELAYYFQGIYMLDNWPEIERSLALKGAWKSEKELPDGVVSQLWAKP